jgi:hypothetical protein
VTSRFNNERSKSCDFFSPLQTQVVQCDQKENKSEQALQIIGHVVAEFYAHKTLLYNKSYLMNFRPWNYNCALCYYIFTNNEENL